MKSYNSTKKIVLPVSWFYIPVGISAGIPMKSKKKYVLPPLPKIYGPRPQLLCFIGPGILRPRQSCETQFCQSIL